MESEAPPLSSEVKELMVLEEPDGRPKRPKGHQLGRKSSGRTRHLDLPATVEILRPDQTYGSHCQAPFAAHGSPEIAEILEIDVRPLRLIIPPAIGRPAPVQEPRSPFRRSPSATDPEGQDRGLVLFLGQWEANQNPKFHLFLEGKESLSESLPSFFSSRKHEEAYTYPFQTPAELFMSDPYPNYAALT